MSLLALPYTSGCLVCGRDNPHGLALTSYVNTESGIISTSFVPSAHHIGFEQLIHGGLLATVLDELMVWAAIWGSGRACVAGEMTVRFVQRAGVGQRLEATASVTRARSRMLETVGELRDESGEVVCSASGKYVPLSVEDTTAFWKTLVEEQETAEAAGRLRGMGR